MQAGNKNVLAISGSVRQNSTNHSLIKAIAELFAGELSVTIYEGLNELPPFNPDYDAEVATPVIDFKEQINKADGVIICTPEYAHGVPGTLKNAIDWTVSSCEFSHKPTVLITASTDGKFGHKALLETLRVIEAKNIDELQMVIQFAKTKISNEHKITDAKTLEEIRLLIKKFIETMHEKGEYSNE